MAKLGRLIENIDELINNIEQVEDYLNGVDITATEEMIHLIGNGTNFVSYKINGEIHFAPSRFVGYLNNTLKVHLVKDNGKNGTKTSPRIDAILGIRRVHDKELEKLYQEYCFKIGATPKNMVNTQRKYWFFKNREIILQEGAVKQVSTNRYERSTEARKRCIEQHGTTCKVCGLNFKNMYGEIGDGFIHVHHIIPLAQKKENHIIEEANLIPVCPNCHAMLHRGNLSVEDLQKIIELNCKN